MEIFRQNYQVIYHFGMVNLKHRVLLKEQMSINHKMFQAKTNMSSTDKYGRSLAKRTIVGLRISLIIALAAALIDLMSG